MCRNPNQDLDEDYKLIGSMETKTKPPSLLMYIEY